MEEMKETTSLTLYDLVFLSFWRIPLPLSDIYGSGGAPTGVSRKGKAPPLEQGRGKYSPPANPIRVTARASERRDNGIRLRKTSAIT
jgi:hypothetical protein